MMETQRAREKNGVVFIEALGNRYIFNDSEEISSLSFLSISFSVVTTNGPHPKTNITEQQAKRPTEHDRQCYNTRILHTQLDA